MGASHGIVGGEAGNHLLSMLRDVSIPVVTTMHTVRQDPSPAYRKVTNQLVELSDRIVVMADRAVQLRREVYDAPEEKIVTIPHGIPDTPFVDPAYHEDQFGVEGRKVLLTFGLVSPPQGHRERHLRSARNRRQPSRRRLHGIGNDPPTYPLDTRRTVYLTHCYPLASGWKDRKGSNWDCGRQDWLIQLKTALDGMLSPVGNDGWYPRHGERAVYDQQPLETHALLEACLEDYSVTADKRWVIEARRCFDWFLGKNPLQRVLYDYETGGCRDGLQPSGLNENQGADSTLAWLLSLLEIRSLETDSAQAESGKAPVDERAGVPV